MKLTGLQLFKYLPGGKKEAEANCKKCGFPTCMAFAMKLAKGETTIDKCEYASDELKSMFKEASRVQQEEIVFGPASRQVRVGNETVMFRHDKKFVNPTCFAIKLESSDREFENKFKKIKDYQVERVGENFKLDALVLVDSDDTFEQKARLVSDSGIPLILVSNDFEALEKILEVIKNSKPLVYFEKDAPEKLSQLQEKYGVPVIITGSTPQELAVNSSKAIDKKINNIVLNLNRLSMADMIQNLTYIRRSAIEEKYKPLGFPVITFMKDIEGYTADPVEHGIIGSVLTCKYSNILVLDDINEAIIYALITLRQNIFTDPEKPLQIEAKVYPIGDVDENSPVIVTTNFALTYFTVAGEIESSNVSTYLVVTPSDGMSVLTAWSADKFNSEIIAKTFKDFGVADLVKHRELIIPGYVSVLKNDIEEDMPDWKVVIGPNEAVEILDFLRNYRKNQMNLQA